jgi:MazG family protein
MKRLRAKGGCPWDRKQTMKSLRRCLLEETHEVLDAIDHKDSRKIEEELGDLMAVIGMMVAIGEEKGEFSKKSILSEIEKKLIRRHPHVFGKEMAKNANHAREFWEREKAKEKGRNHLSFFQSIPKGYPALLEAYKIGKKVAKVGFDWKKTTEVVDKIEEELRELKHEIRRRHFAKIKEEMGDFLFSSAQLARQLDTDPEVALLEANRKFKRRFAKMEELARKQGRQLGELSTGELEGLWRKVKRIV